MQTTKALISSCLLSKVACLFGLPDHPEFQSLRLALGEDAPFAEGAGAHTFGDSDAAAAR
jgi:hypothetical protein